MTTEGRFVRISRWLTASLPPLQIRLVHEIPILILVIEYLDRVMPELSRQRDLGEAGRHHREGPAEQRVRQEIQAREEQRGPDLRQSEDRTIERGNRRHDEEIPLEPQGQEAHGRKEA